jgi:signal transduction histidine kinase
MTSWFLTKRRKMDHSGIDFYQVQTIISFTGIFLFGIITFLKSPDNRLNLAAAAFFICVSLWQLDLFIIRGAHSLEVANLTSRILRPSLIMVPATLLSFSILLSKSKGKVLLLEKIIYALAGLAVLMCITGIGFNPMVYKTGIGYTAQADAVYVIIIIIIVSSLAGFFPVLLKKYYSGDILSQEKKQLQYLMLGVSIGFVGAVINLMNIFGVKIFPIAGFLMLIFFALISYSVLTYDLMNIRELFQKMLMYMITAAFIVVIYLIMDREVFERLNNLWYKIFMFFITTVIIVLCFEPTLKVLDKITRKAFFISNYDYQVLLQHVLFRIRYLKEYEEIFSETALNVTRILRLKSSVFFFWDPAKECFILYSNRRDENVCVSDKHPLVSYINAKKDIVYCKKLRDDIAYDMIIKKHYNDLDVAEMIEMMKKYEAELCVPVIIGGEVKGIWILSEKIGKSIFLREEINWIRNIAAQLSVIVENIALYNQLLKSERFAILGKMAAAVAHEIRNPLTGLSGFVQMVNLDRNNSAALNKFLTIAPGEFKRLEKLTDNLLALGRTTAIRQEDRDLTRIIDETLDFIMHMLRDKKISITVNYMPTPKISVEMEQIKQLVLNIIINASQAMEKGGALEINVAEIEVSGKKYVVASFYDNGPGIDENNIDRLFEPFFTTKSDGTGLGLAISKNIMEAHNGRITINNNNSGRGCTVRLYFPVKN